MQKRSPFRRAKRKLRSSAFPGNSAGCSRNPRLPDYREKIADLAKRSAPFGQGNAPFHGGSGCFCRGNVPVLGRVRSRGVAERSGGGREGAGGWEERSAAGTVRGAARAGTLRRGGGGLRPPDGMHRAAGGAWAGAGGTRLPAGAGRRARHRWRGFRGYFAGGVAAWAGRGPRAATLLISPRMARALTAAGLSLPRAPSMRPTLAWARA